VAARAERLLGMHADVQQLIRAEYSGWLTDSHATFARLRAVRRDNTCT
jgi:hypothetical protein